VGSIDGGDGHALAFLSPEPGSSHLRADLDPHGALSAGVEVELAVSPAIAAIRFEDRTGAPLPAVESAPARFSVYLDRDGSQSIVAVGLDSAGEVAALAELDLQVLPPPADDCHDWLALYQLDVERGPERDGVPDPVTVTTPINGIVHRYALSESPRATFFMDCSLALSLARAASHLRRRDVVDMLDLGVYNYRCIGGGTPPDCPNGISEHAYARAIDIAGVHTADGTYYSVNDDWVISSSEIPTCEAEPADEKDAFLRGLICDLKADGVWSIVLTPNYNAAHRDHFHVDLKPGSDFIRRLGSPGIDLGPDAH
jgi:hypothetical protein